MSRLPSYNRGRPAAAVCFLERIVADEDFRPCHCQYCGREIGYMTKESVTRMWCGKCKKYSVSPHSTMVVRTREQAKSLRGEEKS